MFEIDDDRDRRHCEDCDAGGANSKNNHCSFPWTHLHDVACTCDGAACAVRAYLTFASILDDK
ncbi:hypothetical protein SAMCFNEI73_Ch0639 [Sinorhizobium americanum]|uniref:Uncharacterized protein n=1 Tax=Sinorhizobium americanum TaxID=194963 RepID=A0A1L3LIT9_9HYPH|nr:hypothetical protein SAMCFNEI73_Ch0639 [Sinorhizobium americanum]